MDLEMREKSGDYDKSRDYTDYSTSSRSSRSHSRERRRKKSHHRSRRSKRSRSRSHRRKRYYRSRSCSYSRSRSRSRSYSPRRRSRTRSPSLKRRRYYGTRENPHKSKCLGVFGLNVSTTEKTLTDIFAKYGVLEKLTIVYDAKTGFSRGFAFIYFQKMEDASSARSACNGMTIDDKRIRVDYSITKRAHTPTPGIYMGNYVNSTDDRYHRHDDSGYNDSSYRHSRRHRHRSYSREY